MKLKRQHREKSLTTSVSLDTLAKHGQFLPCKSFHSYEDLPIYGNLLNFEQSVNKNVDKLSKKVLRCPESEKRPFAYSYLHRLNGPGFRANLDIQEIQPPKGGNCRGALPLDKQAAQYKQYELFPCFKNFFDCPKR